MFAETWHPERNGSLTPDQIAAKAKWKTGNIAAYRQCTGFRVPYTYPVCGCTVKVTAEAERHQKKAHPRCFNCHTKWWTESEARIKAEMSKAAKTYASKAAALLDKVPMPGKHLGDTNRYGPQT
ncbi:hypothetical protein ACWDSD_36665 [Streptomyces spiralis]